jgi:hypothetical protein
VSQPEPLDAEATEPADPWAHWADTDDDEPRPARGAPMTWTCVECHLPDTYAGDGDGVGSCMCPRCESCGECRHCADALDLHSCAEDQDWDDQDWDDPDDDDRAETARRTPVETIDVPGGLL